MTNLFKRKTNKLGFYPIQSKCPNCCTVDVQERQEAKNFQHKSGNQPAALQVWPMNIMDSEMTGTIPKPAMRLWKVRPWQITYTRRTSKTALISTDSVSRVLGADPLISPYKAAVRGEWMGICKMADFGQDLLLSQ